MMMMMDDDDDDDDDRMQETPSLFPARAKALFGLKGPPHTKAEECPDGIGPTCCLTAHKGIAIGDGRMVLVGIAQ